MTHLMVENYTRDISSVSQDRLIASWRWLFNEPMSVIIVSNLGDLFVKGAEGRVHWLQCDGAFLEQVAESPEHFSNLLKDETNIDNWFLPALLAKFEASGMSLGPTQVYSPKKLTVLGGSYEVENFRPLDLLEHVDFTGYVCQKLKDLPDGTEVNFVVTS